MGWNYISIPRFQRLHRWSLGMDQQFHPTHYNGSNYLSMLRLQLYHSVKGATDVKVSSIYINNILHGKHTRYSCDDIANVYSQCVIFKSYFKWVFKTAEIRSNTFHQWFFVSQNNIHLLRVVLHISIDIWISHKHAIMNSSNGFGIWC